MPIRRSGTSAVQEKPTSKIVAMQFCSSSLPLYSSSSSQMSLISSSKLASNTFSTWVGNSVLFTQLFRVEPLIRKALSSKELQHKNAKADSKMADQENCVMVTRLAAKKRAAAESAQEHNKKRVVLGEIQNVVSSRDVGLGEKRKCDVAKRKKEVQPKRDAKTSKSSVKDTLDVKEDYNSGIDVVAECDDPQMCGAYVSDIYGYLHNMKMEVKRRPLADYLEKIQKDVTTNIRGILIDGLVEVAEEYKLVSDSLYLTVSYIDRFLSTHDINRQKLQLLGVSSMLIASKYEEINPPHVEDFCYITGNTYPKEEVVKMEADVLKSLKFEMAVETFLRRFTRISQEDYKNLALQYHSRFKTTDLKECICILHDLQLGKKGGSLVAVREKYNQHKFKCVFNIIFTFGDTRIVF